MKKPLVVAHRGFSSIAPENTLASIREAIKAGADMVEIDVHLTADNVPVVIHDSTLYRTTGVKGFVGEKSVSFIRTLDAGSWFSEKYSGEKIPLLSEVLEETRSKCGLLIELKTHTFDLRDLPEQVIKALKDSGRTDIILQSFSSRIINRLKKANGGLELHKLVIGNLGFLPVHLDNSIRIGRTEKYKELNGINHNHRYVTKKLTEKLHQRGQKLYTWTVNTEPEMRKMIDAGVDGIITDKPDLLIAINRGIS